MSRRPISQRQIVFSSFLSSLLAIALCACGPAQPATSPGGGPEPSAPTTSDGEPIGADRQPPAQKLEQSPKLDTNDGIKPAATPPDEKK
jgi:hypothetical protein